MFTNMSLKHKFWTLKINENIIDMGYGKEADLGDR